MVHLPSQPLGLKCAKCGLRFPKCQVNSDDGLLPELPRLSMAVLRAALGHLSFLCLEGLDRFEKNFDKVVHRSRWFRLLPPNQKQFELALRTS